MEGGLEQCSGRARGEVGRVCASNIRRKGVGSLKESENRLAMKDFGGREVVKVNGGKVMKI